MPYKYKLIFIIVLILIIVCKNKEVSADTMNSDWVGTPNKTYELAWQQKESGIYNGYRSYLYLEYTYLMTGSKKYPTFCIDYYKKGPVNNNDYGKIKLKNADMNKSVRDGLIEIMKKGYPNVSQPYGTKDVAEAYYSTSAAIHIWTMYHDVDTLAGKYLGWFTFKDGFSIRESDLNQYLNDYSTKSTASGWHIIGPNNNDSSKRTWNAAMRLLKDAIKPNVKEANVSITKNKDAYIDNGYVVFEYIVNSNLCKELSVRLSKSPAGTKVIYGEEKNKSVVAKVYIPIASVKSGDIYQIYAVGNLYGADDIENYYYLYHKTGQYQTMVYLENDKVRTIESSKNNLQIPNLEFKTYYDLNYSGNNYIKDGDFSNSDSLSYKGDKSISVSGSISYGFIKNYDNDGQVLHVSFLKAGIENCLRLSTLLNSSKEEGFKSYDKELLHFSCLIKANKDITLKLCFENSNLVYEKKITGLNKWQLLEITINKSDSESNILRIFTDDAAELQFYKMQLEPGDSYTEFIDEDYGNADPMFTVHKSGSAYGSVYNGKVPQREYYVFVGWNTKKDGSGIFIDSNDIVPVGNQVLYAIWTSQDTYNIYFHYSANGGDSLIKNECYKITKEGYEVVTVENGEIYNINFEGYRNNFDFIGWSLENNLGAEAENCTVDSVSVDGMDVHLYANYRKTHQVRFHYFDEKSASEQIINKSENYSYNNHPYIGVVIMPGYGNTNNSLNIPVVSGYSMKGWTTNPKEKNEIDYKSGDVEDVVVYDDYYAIYEKQITVKFYDNVYDSDDSSAHNGSSYLHENYILKVHMDYRGNILNAEFQLPDMVCEVNGYDFYGWSDSREFNGSICYYAAESGCSFETDTDLRFYSLYTKKNTVKFYDYDFENNKQHLEREMYAYEYMNYNGMTYTPEIVVQSPCPTDNYWCFECWVLSENNREGEKYYPEEKIKIENDLNFYALYKKGIEIRCHYLVNENNYDVIQKVNNIDTEIYMDSLGKIISDPVKLPEITEFEDEYGWEGIGYSDKDKNTVDVSYDFGKEYFFINDVDLYAVYRTDLFVNYYDYSLTDDNPLIRNEYYELFKTCNNQLHGCKLKVGDTLTTDTHDVSWWSKSDTDYEKDIVNPGEELVIYNNLNLYAYHKDSVSLICNDLIDNKIRTDKYDSNTITDYKGSLIPGIVTIPVQGNNNTYMSSGYWSLNQKIRADYWSGESIKLYTDTVINAIYQKPVTVIYNANGGSFNDNSIEKTETKYAYYNVTGDNTLPVFTPLHEPYKQKFVFNNTWCSDKNGGGDSYKNGVSFVSEKDLILYAQWNIAASPVLSAVNRYFFVGEEIKYPDIVKKIIAKDTYGNDAINSVSIVKINNRRTDTLSNEEIEKIIRADFERQYQIEIKLETDTYVLKGNFIIYIIDSNEEQGRLRYISEEFIDTIDSESKWNYGKYNGELVISFNKRRDDAEYKYTIEGKGEK